MTKTYLPLTELHRYKEENNLTWKECSVMTGIGERLMYYYASGSRAIPPDYAMLIQYQLKFGAGLFPPRGVDFDEDIMS